MTVVALTATLDGPARWRLKRAELHLEQITEQSGENSRTKLQNVVAHRPVYVVGPNEFARNGQKPKTKNDPKNLTMIGTE